MEYKPEESVLMAYLYGELEAEEKEKVEQYLAKHPEQREELEQLKGVRSVLQQWPDQEVMAPMVLPAHHSTIVRKWVPWLSVAAACLLLILVGYATNTQVKYNKGELLISFNGEHSDQPSNEGLNKEEVNQLIQAALVEQNKVYEQQLARLKNTDAASLGSESSTNALAVASWDRTLKEIQVQNMATMNKMLDATSEQQQDYTQAMLTQFNDYLEERRVQDLQAIQSNFVQLQENVALKQSETDQLLSSLMASAKDRTTY